MELVSETKVFLFSDIVFYYIDELIYHSIFSANWFFWIIFGPDLIDPYFDVSIVHDSDHAVGGVA